MCDGSATPASSLPAVLDCGTEPLPLHDASQEGKGEPAAGTAEEVSPSSHSDFDGDLSDNDNDDDGDDEDGVPAHQQPGAGEEARPLAAATEEERPLSDVKHPEGYVVYPDTDEEGDPQFRTVEELWPPIIPQDTGDPSTEGNSHFSAHSDSDQESGPQTGAAPELGSGSHSELDRVLPGGSSGCSSAATPACRPMAEEWAELAVAAAERPWPPSDGDYRRGLFVYPDTDEEGEPQFRTAEELWPTTCPEDNGDSYSSEVGAGDFLAYRRVGPEGGTWAEAAEEVGELTGMHAASGSHARQHAGSALLCNADQEGELRTRITEELWLTSRLGFDGCPVDDAAADGAADDDSVDGDNAPAGVPDAGSEEPTFITVHPDMDEEGETRTLSVEELWPMIAPTEDGGPPPHVGSEASARHDMDAGGGHWAMAIAEPDGLEYRHGSDGDDGDGPAQSRPHTTCVDHSEFVAGERGPARRIRRRQRRRRSPTQLQDGGGASSGRPEPSPAASSTSAQKAAHSCFGKQRQMKCVAPAARGPPPAGLDGYQEGSGASGRGGPSPPGSHAGAQRTSAADAARDQGSAWAAAEGQTTTLMIRNLPRLLTQQELLEEVDRSGFAAAYDFAYLPRDHASGVGNRHAFVNFKASVVAAAFMAAWHGSRRLGVGPDAHALNVAPASVQGFHRNAGKWTVERAARVQNQDLAPFIAQESSRRGEHGCGQLVVGEAGLEVQPAAGQEVTLAVRNLPSLLTQQEFLDVVNREGFAGKYDFAYLPRHRDSGLGSGHAFLNFSTMEAAAAFHHSWHGSHRFASSSGGVALDVALSSAQGFRANTASWTSARMAKTKASFLPFMFKA